MKIISATIFILFFSFSALGSQTPSYDSYQTDLENCDAQSCFNLGIAYKNGQGVAKDLKRTLFYYKKGCTLGDERGCKGYNSIAKQGE